MALIIAPVSFVPQLTAWLLPGLCLAVLCFGTYTAPKHVRTLAAGFAVAVALTGGLIAFAPSVIIKCDPFWNWPWC